MRDCIQEVLSLQAEYSSSNTAAMRRRGALVRKAFSAAISAKAAEVLEATSIADLGVKGNDGVGRKTEIPWVRLPSKGRSPRPTSGWYVVYLFSRTGERSYLSLIQATTSWDGFGFKRRPGPELLRRSQWARRALQLMDSLPAGWTHSLRLDGRRGGLGEGYELGNVVGKEYSADAVPEEAELRLDLAQALTWLGMLYDLEDEGLYVPSDSGPDLSDVQTAIDVVAGKPARSQGIRLTGAERLVVERLAVERATRFFEMQGYSVTDVGDHESYDLLAQRDDASIFIEVKGTTSTGTEIILTRNEVLLHQERYPSNALAIVHSIRLDRTGEMPTASGGCLCVEQPWQLENSQLTPLAFRYTVS
ncbi:MrcB family domain-containing protein [Pseudarthrobacter sp. NKDBFgelt]|uniref:MrcB family domain-containing protein n=1 Tax=Pseudarthrobacter sp. NKDBFgelt TaxID=3384443 RepID=UPI0038D4C438